MTRKSGWKVNINLVFTLNLENVLGKVVFMLNLMKIVIKEMGGGRLNCGTGQFVVTNNNIKR